MWFDLLRKQPDLRTPCFVYNLEALKENAASYRRVAAGRCVRVLYATMANPRPEVLRAVREVGLGAFVNSIEHLRLALDAGIAPADIVFAGSGHGAPVQRALATLGVEYCADSTAQLDSYRALRPVGRYGVRVNVCSLLAHCRFADPAPRLGLTIGEVRRALGFDRSVAILHAYVGTNLTSSEIYLAVLDALTTLGEEYEQVREIDLGGGFALPPIDGSALTMWQAIMRAWHERTRASAHRLRLTIEPGRSIARTAGMLFATVTDVKVRGDERYVVVNTSSSWYPRRLIHGAEDHVVRVCGRAISSSPLIMTSICGASTYSNDILARLPLPVVRQGDVLQFDAAGAYCESMHLDFLGMERPTFWACEGGRIWQLETGAGVSSTLVVDVDPTEALND